MIEIHLDGKPVTKLEAARALNQVNSGNHVCIGEMNGRGWVEEDVYLRARHSAYGEVQPPELGCMSFHADTVAGMRRQAEMISLAAEIRELADVLAAEQVTEFRTSSTGVMARCRQPGDHGPAPEGATLDCDVAAHHQPRLCEYCDVEPAAEGKYCAECAPAVRLASGAA